MNILFGETSLDQEVKDRKNEATYKKEQ